MKTNIEVKICSDLYQIRTVTNDDAEILRVWKNNHKEFFFYKKEITPEQQIEWINSLALRDHDHMCIVIDNDKPIGCIGARLHDDCVDVYNVILGEKKYKGLHIMTNALWVIVSFCNLVYPEKPVRVKVLQTNPAINWYEKIGFELIDHFDDHVIMQFRISKISESYNFKINITLPYK